MTYTEDENRNVRLEMTLDDYLNLLFYLGIALGATLDHAGEGVGLNLLRFVNALNRGNPRFVPYLDPPMPGEQRQPATSAMEP